MQIRSKFWARFFLTEPVIHNTFLFYMSDFTGELASVLKFYIEILLPDLCRNTLLSLWEPDLNSSPIVFDSFRTLCRPKLLIFWRMKILRLLVLVPLEKKWVYLICGTYWLFGLVGKICKRLMVAGRLWLWNSGTKWAFKY